MNAIHILGASGSGTSTLGRALALRLPYAHYDSDDYYWLDKFTQPRPPAERVRLLKDDLAKQRQWILSGAISSWGDALKSDFDLVVFLHTPAELRLRRLREREYERYGDRILAGGSMYEQSQAFMEWAALYDEAGMDVRSRTLHEHWMSDLTCPVLRLEGDLTVQERADRVIQYLNDPAGKRQP